MVFPLVVREPVTASGVKEPPLPLRQIGRELFTTRTAICTYLGSGLSMFIQGAFVAWMPSYLNRYHDMDPAGGCAGRWSFDPGRRRGHDGRWRPWSIA